MSRIPYQVFANEDELKQYVIAMDPMKEFVPVKREINWDPDERECNECGTKFKPEHPAQHFCKNCQNKEDKKNKRESVVERMKKNPSIAICESCGAKFYKTAPAMRNCIHCSPKGGELVKNNN